MTNSELAARVTGRPAKTFFTFLFLILNSLFLIRPAESARAADDVKLDLSKIKDITIDQNNYGALVMDIVQLVFAFLAVMAFAGIIYSGVMMITAGGDAAKFAAGKKNLVWAIIGIIVATLSYFILQFAALFFKEAVG